MSVLGVLIDYRLELALWVALSFVLHAVASDLAWHYRRPRPGRLGRWVEGLRSWPYTSWLLQGLRFLYYIGIPYLALLRGAALPRLMGLSGLDWPKGVSLGVPLGGGAFLVLALIWWWYARAIAGLPNPSADPDPAASWWVVLREVIYVESHWAFYRCLPILLLDDYYTGVFLGFLLVSLEWWISPAWRAALSLPEGAPNVLMSWSMAFAMAIVFLFVRNLWLIVPIHWAIEMGCRRMLAIAYRQEGV